MINQFLEMLNKAKNIAIITHINPDGDAFGSALMMHEFLSINFPNINKSIFAEHTHISDEFKLMLEDIKLNENLYEYDTVITVDCGDTNRFEMFMDIFNSAKQTISIDHHKDNSYFAQLNIVNVMSSNCENLFNIFKQMGFKINKRLCGYCYAGMITDTLAFSVKTITPNTYKVLEEIMEMGVDCYRIRNLFFNGFGKEKYKIIAKTMEKAEFYLNDKVVIVYLDENDFAQCGLDINNTEGIVNQAFSLKTALACFLVSPRKEKLHISMRSKPGIDVSVIANKLGGGGHVCAAAGDSEKGIDEIKKFIITEIEPQIISFKEIPFKF